MNKFVHQKGTKLVDGEGKALLLRGMGLGNWLLPEGYMWLFFTKCDRPRRIEKLVCDLLGEDGANEFWNQYYSSYITRKDIEYIKSCGLNSVRLPMNARHLMMRDGDKRCLLQEGLGYVDKLLSWCAEFGIYVILDMHAAPGGQTGTNIDDSKDDCPLLFEDETYCEDTIWLWRELAKRYAHNKTIAGYDLLNEPLPNWFAEHNDKVLPLYRDITAAIREVDNNHLIILEGVHWATDWTIFKSLKERGIDNCMLQFHKYWSNPDTESLQTYLDMRNELGYPIYMGEGGENNTAWYTGVFHLFEQHDISWNFWSYKKLDTHNSPISIEFPHGWQELINYINGAKKPNDAPRILREFLEKLYFKNCIINDQVICHVARQAPLKIPAVYYDIAGVGIAKEKSDISLRQEDRAKIRFVAGEAGELCFKHYGGEEPEDRQRLCLAISKGESFRYSFSAKGQSITVHCRTRDNGCIQACINGRTLGQYPVKHNTMHELVFGEAAFGINVLEIKSVSGEVEVEWIQIG